MKIDRIDHIVLTVASVDATIEFYSRVLAMKPITFDYRNPDCRCYCPFKG